MNTLDLEEDYKERVLEIWNKFKVIPVLNENECEYRQSPLLPKTVKKDAILFIGINPAFSTSRKQEIINKEIEFYPLISNEKEEITYFKKFQEIASYCNNSEWTHLDLFFMRETNQEVIERLCHGKFIDFLQEQLEITFEIINKINPKIIVVSNSLASEFFGKKKQKHLETV